MTGGSRPVSRKSPRDARGLFVVFRGARYENGTGVRSAPADCGIVSRPPAWLRGSPISVERSPGMCYYNPS